MVVKRERCGDCHALEGEYHELGCDLERCPFCGGQLISLERRRERYLGNRERAEVAGRTAIVIDDGIATGATTRAALRATRTRNPKRLVLAVPVAPSDILSELRREADDIRQENRAMLTGRWRERRPS